MPDQPATHQGAQKPACDHERSEYANGNTYTRKRLQECRPGPCGRLLQLFDIGALSAKHGRDDQSSHERIPTLPCDRLNRPDSARAELTPWKGAGRQGSWTTTTWKGGGMSARRADARTGAAAAAWSRSTSFPTG